MKQSTRTGGWPQAFAHSTAAQAVALALTSIIAAPIAQAFEIDTGNPDVKMHWDNTVKYSAAWRLKGQSNALINNPPTTVNQDDGDRNFNTGVISSRFDLYSEFDVTYKEWGARLSGAAWYDSVYNRNNANNSPATANQYTVPYNQFTNATRILHGRDGELLDAFGFGAVDIGDTKLTFRAGQYALIWGESLFFGANGIAGGQAPVDIIKALSVPNTRFNELIRPVPQVSAQWQINPKVSVGAYYQLQWENNRFPAVGSYFNSGDLLDWGGERLLVGGPLIPGGGPAAFFRSNDLHAKNSGQGGVQVRFRVGETDYGLYAIRYNDKSPQLYIKPSVDAATGTAFDPSNFNPVTGQIGQYYWVYPENIQAYGASFSDTIGEFNIAGEASIRRNTPLVSDAQTVLFGMVPPAIGGPTVAPDNNSNPLYAVGNSVHAQLSTLASLPPSFIAIEASLLAEIAWNRLTGITKNRNAIDPIATRDATNIQVVYQPTYRQVLPGLDLSVPVGVLYGIQGKSSVVANFVGPGVGNLSVGLAGAYLDAWRFGVTCTHYFGSQGTFLDAGNHISYQQSLHDRDFISVSIYRTF
jgi:hypothetical protein